MLEKKIYSLLIHNLQQKPTKLQEKALKMLSNFVEDINERGIFLLKGYAGTGKTTLISSLVKSLLPMGKKSGRKLMQVQEFVEKEPYLKAKVIELRSIVILFQPASCTPFILCSASLLL